MLTYKVYAEHDALGLADLIRRGETTATEVLEAAIRRAEEVDPTIGALTQRFDERALARSAEAPGTGPFAGVPFLFKDLYTWQAGLPAENGSRLWKGFVAPVSFTFVDRAEASGLNPFGRTKSSEDGISFTTEPAALGPTRNPWDLDRTAGGSSGGSAAAVAAGIVPMAHGSDGGGSIRMPASQCGLFGLKPSRGRVPSGPLVGEGWAGLATSHVITRSVRDSAAFLDAVHGPEPGDPYACAKPAGPFRDEVGVDPGRLRVAIHLEGLDGDPLDPENQAAVRRTAALLSELGHDVAEARPELDIDVMAGAMRTIIAANQANSVRMRYAALGRDQDGWGLERTTWDFAQRAAEYTAGDYARALTAFHALGRTFGAFFETYDVLVSTTMRRPPFPLGTVDTDAFGVDGLFDHARREMPVTQFFNMTGCPAMSVPLHWTADGLPVGIHVGAAFGREDLLIRLAAQLEEAKPWFHLRPAL